MFIKLNDITYAPRLVNPDYIAMITPDVCGSMVTLALPYNGITVSLYVVEPPQEIDAAIEDLTAGYVAWDNRDAAQAAADAIRDLRAEA